MACCGDPRCETDFNPCSLINKVQLNKPVLTLEELNEQQKRWAKEEPDQCRENIIKKYVWTTTYREMNKDGAALPITVRECPLSSREWPPGDPVQRGAEMAPKALMDLGEVFEKWDRPQVRRMAGRCDTMKNRPDLTHDAYFQEHKLCRAKYARPPEAHPLPTKENLELVKKNMLRQPYDRMIPGYGGYECFIAPPVCKVTRKVDPVDPYETVSIYQESYTLHPKEVYENSVKPMKPSDVEKNLGVSTNPLSTLGRLCPLPVTGRLSCYLECDWEQCPKNYVKVDYNCEPQTQTGTKSG